MQKSCQEGLRQWGVEKYKKTRTIRTHEDELGNTLYPEALEDCICEFYEWSISQKSAYWIYSQKVFKVMNENPSMYFQALTS